MGTHSIGDQIQECGGGCDGWLGLLQGEGMELSFVFSLVQLGTRNFETSEEVSLYNVNKL